MEHFIFFIRIKQIYENLKIELSSSYMWKKKTAWSPIWPMLRNLNFDKYEYYVHCEFYIQRFLFDVASVALEKS